MKNRNVPKLILITMFWVLLLFGQAFVNAADPPLMEWIWPDDQNFQTNIVASSMDQTFDGGYVIAGHSYDSTVYDLDFELIKIDKNGTVEWRRIYNDTVGWEQSPAVTKTSDGGYILAGRYCGTTRNCSPITSDIIYILKVDSVGTKQWDTTLSGNLGDWAGQYDITDIFQVDGGYILGGSKFFSGTEAMGGEDSGWTMFLMKINTLKTIVWEKDLGGNPNIHGDDYQARSVIQTDTGGFALAGVHYFNPVSDACLIITDPQGIEVNRWTYGIQDRYEEFFSIDQTSDGGYLLGGTKGQVGGSYEWVSSFVVKYDSSLSNPIEWEKEFPQSYDTYGAKTTSIDQTIDGEYIIGRYGDTHQILKLDENGDEKWFRSFDWSSDILSIHQTRDTGYIIFGSINWAGGIKSRLIKLEGKAAFDVHVDSDYVHAYNWPANANLTLTIDDPTNGPGIDFASSATVDSSGSDLDIYFCPFDVKAGHTVTITDGTKLKDHVVTNIEITSVDTANDTVTGTAAPGSQVKLVDSIGTVPDYIATADSLGNWIADFSTISFDLHPFHGAEVEQRDSDGDATLIGWNIILTVADVSGVVTSSSQSEPDHQVVVGELIRAGDAFELDENSSFKAINNIFDTIWTVFSYEGAGSIIKFFSDSNARYKQVASKVGKTGWTIFRKAKGATFKPITVTPIMAARGSYVFGETTEDEWRIHNFEGSIEVWSMDGGNSMNLAEQYGIAVTDQGFGNPFPTDLSEVDKRWDDLITISVASPVDLYVTDPLGLHVGRNPEGNIVNEIPDATYNGPDVVPEQIFIPAPKNGTYDIDLSGTGYGDYHLSVLMDIGKESSFEYFSGTIEENQTINYEISVETYNELGDINEDGSVDLKDVIAGLQVLVRHNSNEISTQNDVNGDAKIGLEDIIHILKKVSEQ